MVDYAKQMGKSVKPWLLHLQKLGLELKCSLCLDLLKRPFLLPCDHIFCNTCTPRTTQFGSECPLCQAKYSERDLRPLLILESLVTIYKNLEAANRFQSVSTENDVSKYVATNGTTDRDSEMVSGGSDRCISTQDANCLKISSHITAPGLQKCGTERCFMTQVDHLTPGSPPSFGDIKDSENDSSFQSPHNYKPPKSVMQSIDDLVRVERRESSASETDEGYTRDSKRHKTLDYGQSDICARNMANAEQIISERENSEACHSQVRPKSMVAQVEAQTGASGVEPVCGFCQSSIVSEDTGPMLHYINGKLVKESEATLPDVIHVHNLCIEWAPKVYYVGETVKNLNAELARGSKLKCAKCGLKGAALGCYLKSCRRSYHAPCAMGISKCRWDYENFLVLCPAHSSVKFPNEKSKPKKSKLQNFPVETPGTPEQSSFWAGLSEAKEWVFCGSALSSEDKCLLVEFGSMISVPVTKFWKSNVTHVIAATDTSGACTRTLKVLMAILNGRWVITIDWIKACMQSMRPVDEEPYEVSLDNCGSRDGPKFGRLRAVENAPKLFSRLSFHFVGEFLRGYKEDIENLVFAAGGTIVQSEEELGLQSQDQEALSRTLIIYNLDPPQGCKLGDEVTIIWQRACEAGDLASKFGCQVVGHTWLLESIAGYKVQPIVS